MSIDVTLTSAIGGVTALHFAAPTPADGQRFRSAANPLAALVEVLSELSNQPALVVAQLQLQDASAALAALNAAKPGTFWGP